MKFLLEIPIKGENSYTSVKIIQDEISYIEKGRWDNERQDWEAVIILKNGRKFDVCMPIYTKLIAIGE